MMTAATAIQRRPIAALVLGMFIYSLGMGTTYPLIGVVLAQQTSGGWNGLNAAATGLGLLLGVVLAPALSRRIGAGATVLVGVAAMAAALLLMSLTIAAAPSVFWPLFGLRMVLGCGANLMFVVGETALNVFSEPARRGRVIGLYTAAVASGFVIGPGFVALAGDRPAALLLVCAGITAVALVPLCAVRPALDRSVVPASVRRLPRAVAAAPLAFGFVVVASAVDAVAISLLPVIATGQSFTTAQGAVLVAVFHVGLLLGQPLIGFALDAAGRRRTVLACLLVSLICAVAMMFGARLDFAAVCLLMLLWGGANFGLYTAGLAILGDRFDGAALTAATAAFAGVYAVASTAAPLLAGTGLDAIGATGLYAAAAAVYLAATLIGVLTFRPAEPAAAFARAASRT